jgi:ASC-1-like (ASCH) protein
MSRLDISDHEALLSEVLRRVEDSDTWLTFVRDAINEDTGSRAHLAVMHEPYLTYILDGRKTIESRFSVNRVAPYRSVMAGDILVFKLVAGPVVAVASVADVTYYQLDSHSLPWLRERFSAALAAEDESFWTDRREARYATLMRLGSVRRLRPFWVRKPDRRGWVVLSSRLPGIHPEQMVLDGAPEPGVARRPRRSVTECDHPEKNANQLSLTFDA